MTEDGAFLVTDVGTGISKAGWHPIPNPPPLGDCPGSGGAPICPQCQAISSSGGKCPVKSCRATSGSCNDGLYCTTGDTCQGGVCKGTKVDDVMGATNVIEWHLHSINAAFRVLREIGYNGIRRDQGFGLDAGNDQLLREQAGRQGQGRERQARSQDERQPRSVAGWLPVAVPFRRRRAARPVAGRVFLLCRIWCRRQRHGQVRAVRGTQSMLGRRRQSVPGRYGRTRCGGQGWQHHRGQADRRRQDRHPGRDFGRLRWRQTVRRVARRNGHGGTRVQGWRSPCRAQLVFANPEPLGEISFGLPGGGQ